jgi:hypothetical protein
MKGRESMKRTSVYLWIVGLGAAGLLSCGGDEGGTPTTPVAQVTATPTPAPRATATATAAATEAPTPTPGPEDEHDGPVATVFTRVFVVRDKQGGEQIPGPFAAQFPGTPYYDEKTNTERVPLGTFFILDTTPKNAAGQKCQAHQPPTWITPHGGKFEPLANNGIGSNPFQYRANARAKGVVEVYTFVDGVRSNVINVDIY